MNRIRLRVASLFLIFLSTNVAAWAGITGSISGSVLDSSGALVPRVQVIATEVTTNVAFKTLTNDSGSYSFLALPVGEYRLEAQATGFKSYQQVGIKLDANDALRLDISLQIGQPSQT